MADQPSAAQQEYDRLVAMLPAVERELKAKYKDVRGVTVALKQTGGEFGDQLAFRVYVAQKRPEHELRTDQVVPKAIRGVPTDVWNELKLVPISDGRSYRPLMGGIQIAGGAGGTGTMGCVATLTAGPHSGRAVLLSNHHVLYGKKGKDGDLVGQASYSSCICCSCCGIGVNEASSATNDCAIALLDSDVRYSNEIKDIGLIAGTNVAHIHSAASPYIVRKRGARTELTDGRVTSLSAGDTLGGTARSDLIEIAPNAGHKRFAYYGDSGSVLVNSDNEVVGLVYSIDAATETLGYAIPIASVTAALNINIERSGTAGAIPLFHSDARESAPTTSQRERLDAIATELDQTAWGRKIHALVERHWDEVRRLVNTDRVTKVAWQRFQGPAFVAHLMKSAKQPDYQIPEQIGGVMLQNLALRMAMVLEQRGSTALRADVQRHRREALALLQGCRRIRDVLDRVKQRVQTHSADAEEPAPFTERRVVP